MSNKSSSKFLSISIPVCKDWNGLIMTLTSLKLYHKDSLNDIEVVILDNTDGTNPHSLAIQNYIALHTGLLRVKYIIYNDTKGTAAAKNEAIRNCTGEFVLAMDSHIMLPPNTIDKLITLFKGKPTTDDLYQGPYIADTGNTYVGTHFKPVWSGGMFGQWETGTYTASDKFEILMQGMGLFAFRRESWPGFHPLARGFGGEEYYIHERYRQLGRKCWSVSWLEWWHRCGHVDGIPYDVNTKDIVWNYLLSAYTLGTPTYKEIYEHFVPTQIHKKRFELLAELIRRDKSLCVVTPNFGNTFLV